MNRRLDGGNQPTILSSLLSTAQNDHARPAAFRAAAPRVAYYDKDQRALYRHVAGRTYGLVGLCERRFRRLHRSTTCSPRRRRPRGERPRITARAARPGVCKRHFDGRWIGDVTPAANRPGAVPPRSRPRLAPGRGRRRRYGDVIGDAAVCCALTSTGAPDFEVEHGKPRRLIDDLRRSRARRRRGRSLR